MKTVLLHGLGQTAQDWKEVVQYSQFYLAGNRLGFLLFFYPKTERRTEHHANQS